MPSPSLWQSREDPASGQALAGGDEGLAPPQGPLCLPFQVQNRGALWREGRQSFPLWKGHLAPGKGGRKGGLLLPLMASRWEGPLPLPPSGGQKAERHGVGHTWAPQEAPVWAWAWAWGWGWGDLVPTSA